MPEDKPKETDMKDIAQDYQIEKVEEVGSVTTIAEEPQQKAISFSQNLQEESEDELPKRNPVPDGASETIEDETNFVSPPSSSQKQSEASMVTSEVEKENVMDLDEASGTLPWEMYRYIKKEDREETDTDFEEYDGQQVGDGMLSINLFIMNM